MSKPHDWTPKEIQDKKAGSLQTKFYGAGVVSGIISWISFSNNSEGAGALFTIVAIIAFAIGSLIRTTFKKKAQADTYVKDKERESLRRKIFIAGFVCGAISFISFCNDGQDVGGFFAVVSAGGFLAGGLVPVKWIKHGETSIYHK